MRQLVGLAAILIGSVICLTGTAGVSVAGPLPALSAAFASQSLAEAVGWRRYCRRYGCGPDVVLPGVVAPGVDVDVDVDVSGADVDADVDVDLEPPAIVVLPPPRPLSCGQYHYWNGERCVDARYNDPYLGPR